MLATCTASVFAPILAGSASADTGCTWRPKSGQTVKVRTGPGTDYLAVGQLSGNDFLFCNNTSPLVVTGGTYTACGGTSNQWAKGEWTGGVRYAARLCVQLG